MALIAGDQVVGARFVCTFEKNVVAGVAGGLDRVGWRHHMGVVPNEFEKLPAEAFGNAQLRARQDHKIFGKNWSGDVEPGRLGKGQRYGFSSPGLQAPSISGGVSLSLNPCDRRRGREGLEELGNGEDTLAVEIGALLFCHTAEQAEVIFFNSLLSTAVLEFALGTVSVQNQVGT